MTMADKEWDAFISHASEDKDDFVRPLAKTLAQLGVKVWYDEFTLKVGDSLSRSIDEGLAGSRYGIVVISPSFIQKKWPERELRGLVQREVLEEEKLILPIWFGVTQQEVVGFSPTLSDAYALRVSDMDAEQIALALLKIVRPDIYREHPRSELQKLLSGEALQDLQDELEYVKEELAQFQCPYCASPLSARNEVELDADLGVSGSLERFVCGYAHVDGALEQPCPSDPLFPKFEDYELVVRESKGQWTCYAQPKTKMARHLSVLRGVAWTEEEAKDQVFRWYERAAQKWKP
jgi:hypothetical protein